MANHLLDNKSPVNHPQDNEPSANHSPDNEPTANYLWIMNQHQTMFRTMNQQPTILQTMNQQQTILWTMDCQLYILCPNYTPVSQPPQLGIVPVSDIKKALREIVNDLLVSIYIRGVISPKIQAGDFAFGR